MVGTPRAADPSDKVTTQADGHAAVRLPEVAASIATARYPRARWIAEALAALLGLCLLAAAALADTRWFDSHFTPEMFYLRPRQMAYLWTGRGVAAALGLVLLLVVRPRFGRLAARRPPLRLALDVVGRGLLPIVLAICVSEAVLQSQPWRAAQEAAPTREPLRRHDPYFGWLSVTNHAGYGRTRGGQRVLYALDSHGYRVRRPGGEVDLDRPSVIFTGESIIFGYGLTWDQSIPGQVQRLTGLQAADIAVVAYAPDQAYLRLRSELPRFRRPVAVVTIFIPPLFGRILTDDRPHLGAGLTPQPETPRWRLLTLAKRLIPYRSPRELDRGVEVTREIYRATLEAAQARGAIPIVLVPTYLPEPPAVRAIRHKVLDEAGIPYLEVPIEPAWRIPGDKHPDARADKAIAEAIARRLAKGEQIHPAVMDRSSAKANLARR